MYALTGYTPRRGLSVPLLSACNADGVVQEEDQRRLVRYAVSGGFGVDIVFCNGTNGEWNRLAPEERNRVIAITCDEVRSANAKLTAAGHEPVEAWAGITGHTVEECVLHLQQAIEHGADGVVFAPLSVRDLPGVVDVFHSHITPCMDEAGRHIPLQLYDNADIAVDPHVPHLHTRDVKQLSRLDYVIGAKVSAPPKVLGNYTKAAMNFNERHEFGIYVGDAFQIFTLFKPAQGFLDLIRDYWRRYWLQAPLPVGVVSGYANVFPREWQRAWLACDRGETVLMEDVKNAFDQFRKLTRIQVNGAVKKKTLACMKSALSDRGILSDSSVAPGTPALTSGEEERFLPAYRDAAEAIRTVVDERWRTPIENGV